MNTWQIDTDALESIAIGAGILGTGGGGNPYLGKLRVRRMLEQGHPIRVIPPESLPDDAVVSCVGGIGAPTVGIEKLQQGSEMLQALRALETYSGQSVDAVVSVEMGGGNSIGPMIVAAQTGLPVVDADGMGRAFPEIQMVTFFIYGVPCVPAALADERGNQVIFDGVQDARFLERMARNITIQMGCTAGFAMPLMSGAQVKQTAVVHTLSLAREIGDAVREARRLNTDPIAAILTITDGELLFRGKLVDVERWTTAGFARGRMRLEGLDEYSGQELSIEFQNENLVAYRNGEVSVTVPDLICLVDIDTGEPITTELLRYGYRAAVLAIPCSAKMRTPEALAVVGPRAFGYDVEYKPLPKRSGVGIL